MQINNMEIAKQILQLIKNPKTLEQVADYKILGLQLTKKELDVLIKKFSVKHTLKFLIKRINQAKMQNELEKQGSQNFWRIHEYKSYMLILCCLSYQKQNGKTAFVLNDVIQCEQNQLFINWMFCQKSSIFLQYVSRSVQKRQKQDREKWLQEEQKLLQSILMRPGFRMKWAKASVTLFIESNKLYFRSPRKCRQAWFNRLNPSVNHGKWTIQEDQKLIIHIYQYGKKWANISKQFNQSRNEHMVKNRFYFLLKKYHLQILQTGFNDTLLLALLKIICLQKNDSQVDHVYQNMKAQEAHRLSNEITEDSFLLRNLTQAHSDNCQELNLHFRLSSEYLKDNIQEQPLLKFNEQYEEQREIPYFKQRLLLIDNWEISLDSIGL